MCNQCWQQLCYNLPNCFSNFNVHRNHQGFSLKCRFWFSKSRRDPILCISNKPLGAAAVAVGGLWWARQQRQCLERSPKWVLRHCNLATRSEGREVRLDPESHWTRRKTHWNPSPPSQDGQDPGAGIRLHTWAVSKCHCAGLGKQRQGMTQVAFVARMKGSKN